MSGREYSLTEMNHFIHMVEGMYDIVRLIDPVECREIQLMPDRIVYGCECYDVWKTDHRCSDCSSYKACMSGCRLEKSELFRGTMFHIQSNPVKLRMPDGTLFPCVLEMITGKKASIRDRAEKMEKEMADKIHISRLHDSLTGLYNWEGFGKVVRCRLSEAPEMPRLLIAADIVQFKLISSLFGREKADAILMELAKQAEKLSSDDVIFGRVHEDQLAVCVPKERFSEQKIRGYVNNLQNLLGGSAYSIQVHVGVFEITDPQMSISVMFDRAVMALASLHGNDATGFAYFDDKMLEDMLHKQKVISEFERTLKNGEYHIFLQPQVTKDGHVQGAEALVRWIRPNGEIVPPMEFIGILEDAGLIAKLDSYVWELAAALLARWKYTAMKDLYISVNISALDFYYVDVYETFLNLVEKYQIDRKKLRLEITETALMSDEEKQLPLVEKLRSAGFFIEIDDFGKGYSSLSMLKDIEADVLKIDMRFLSKTKNKERSSTILGSVINMTNQLDMGVITEGVETKEQLDDLVEKGCRMFQGFYFAKPMPVHDFEEICNGTDAVSLPV